MPDKTQLKYERAFQIVKDKRPDCDPENVTLDFEKSGINAFMKAFPNANVNGCFFISLSQYGEEYKSLDYQLAIYLMSTIVSIAKCLLPWRFLIQMK